MPEFNSLKLISIINCRGWYSGENPSKKNHVLHSFVINHDLVHSHGLCQTESKTSLRE